MLTERNENQKIKQDVLIKQKVSPKKINKLFKENILQINSKEMFFKSSCLFLSEPPAISEDFFTIETNKIKSSFIKKIIANELSKNSSSYKNDFLKHHLFSAEIRARMVN